ncbi:MAG: NAD-binding protein [Candidatus Cloacimonadota bacterium]|nr:NAD-binding protein [Candidatus Cloacimonadota bacterium]
MNILIVGGGKVVYFLCRTFLSKGYKVTVINRDQDECTWLARRLKVTVVYGDGSDSQILEEAGADAADAVLAVTPNDQDNLEICQLADLRFRVQRTLALVNDPDNEEVFRQLGITAAFSTTRILSSLIEQRAGFEEITNLIPASEGKVNITEVVLKETSPVVGQPLIDIALPENSLVASILREGQAIIPRGTTVLQDGDHLIVISLPENLGQVLKALTGNMK